jgi:uncharacterized protein
MQLGPSPVLSRRTFLRSAGAVGAGSLLLAGTAAAEPITGPFPTRVLGRTHQNVTTLTLGTWPCGRSRDVPVDAIVKLVHESLELGVNHIDTARGYGKAEEAIGIALEGSRDKVFLASKVWADTAVEAAASLRDSLQKLRTDHLDLVYIHGIGNRDVERVMAQDGSLDFLVRQKEQGVIRFIGISGHSYPDRFAALINTGKVDVLLAAMNFVDVHTYDFEHKVLPLARRQDLGIACMKVLGGMRGGFAAADGPNTGPMVPPRLFEQAVRYALGIPDVATLVIGPHTLEQLREDVRLVRAYQPLPEDELQSLLSLGKQLAPTWGPHFGPVA